MVGAAQYRDDEIDWVLSAVVNKKKQSYIQAKFKDKFGRGLNHNQIRYIKNKYGKDPRFNSPLVNTRAPKTGAASPPESVLGTTEYDNEEDDAGSPAVVVVAGPSTLQPRDAQLRTPSKRKRSIQDEGDSLESNSLLQHSAKNQRLNPPAHTCMMMPQQLIADTPLSSSRWNAMAAQSHAHAHTLSPPVTAVTAVTAAAAAAATATPAETATLYTSAYDAGQQPLLQGTSGGINWATPSMSGSVWDFGASPSLINTGGHPAANFNSSSYYADHQTPASYAFPSPVTTRQPLLLHPHNQQQQQQLPQLHLANMPPPRFSPAMPHLTCSPYPQGQQQQHQQPHAQTQGYNNTNQGCFTNNNPPALTSPEHTPPGHHPVPSFEEVPIEDATWDDNNNIVNPRTSTSAPGAAQDWSRVTYAPYEPSPFDPVPPPMEFPFETVPYAGLTSNSARTMYKALRDEVENQQRRTGQAVVSNSNSNNSNHHSPVVRSLDMLNMVTHHPTATATNTSNAAYHHHQQQEQQQQQQQQHHRQYHHYSQTSSSSSKFPPHYPTTHDHAADVDPFLGTIDPRLLVEQHPSLPTAHRGGHTTFGVSPPPDLPEPDE